jgi:predicted secreted protein
VTVLRRAAVPALGVAGAGCGALPPMPPLQNPFDPPPLAVRVAGTGGGPIVLARGQTLIVSLEGDLATGYRWEAMAGYAPTLIALGTPDYTARDSPPEVGVPGDMAFRFRGDTPGSTVLEFAYQRPFEPGVPPVRTERYHVTVR